MLEPVGVGGAGGAGDQAAPAGGEMLAEWRETLAIMAANRTKDDERVMLRLGDRLWEERRQVCCVLPSAFYYVGSVNILL